MGLLTIIIVDGFLYAAILFLLSVGLTLIFGVLRILNISHGVIYALGAYMATWLAQQKRWILSFQTGFP